MKRLSLPLALLAAAVLLPFCAQAQTYLNETFEDDAIGAVPADSTQRSALLTTVIAGSGAIGTSHVANFNDASTTAGGGLEYNVGSAALGNLYVQYDLFNNAANNTGTAANPIIFGVGPYNNAAGSTLTANASRAFNIEYYQTGSSGTLRLRVGANTVGTNSTYDMTLVQTTKIFINDNDTNTLSYTRPDGGGIGVLGANSFVVFVNNALINGETTTGFAMNTTAGNIGDTTGNATVGRLGFNSSSTNTANFLIDNVFASSVPEPSTYALCAVALVAGVVASRRRVRLS